MPGLITKSKAIYMGILPLLVVLGVALYFAPQTEAADLSKFKAGYIISDTAFTDKGSMSVSQIQSFLNGKVPTCDTNGTQPASEFGRPDLTHAQYAASRGWQAPPYICLKNFSQGGKSAAQIIYDKAQEFSINPKVLIVLLQKEQALVTDTWPLNTQYRSATGYGCPDTAACDSQYYGFTNQVTWAARMFRAIMDDSPTWYTPYELGNNQIPWNPNTGSCGYSTVNILNRATQALYNYTPYRPNQAALNAGYGTGDSCSSYGNRNFYAYFTDWFGSTTKSYEASIVSASVFSDAGRTNQLNYASLSANPGQTLYVRIVATNTGMNTWNSSFTRVATIEPRNHKDSIFKDTSWLGDNRPNKMKESSVASGSNGTFEFSIKMPNDIGTFSDSFGLVAEGKDHGWMDENKVSINVNVVANLNYASTILSSRTYLDAAMTKEISLQSKSVLPNKDIYARILFKNIGIQNLDSSFTSLATTNPRNHTNSPFLSPSWDSSNRPAAIKESSVASGQNGTIEFVLRSSSTDGVYSGSFGLVAEGKDQGWMDDNKVSINMTVRSTIETLYPGGRLFKGEQLNSHNGDYRLILQADSNLVLYSRNGPVWASDTNGKSAHNLVMQGDGNLVLYGTAGKPIWASGTNGSGSARISMQNDGNAVIYRNGGGPLWATNTKGR